eukprot:ANDGO_06504.mRNA.1 hypothetical protein
MELTAVLPRSMVTGSCTFAAAHQDSTAEMELTCVIPRLCPASGEEEVRKGAVFESAGRESIGMELTAVLPRNLETPLANVTPARESINGFEMEFTSVLPRSDARYLEMTGEPMDMECTRVLSPMESHPQNHSQPYSQDMNRESVGMDLTSVLPRSRFQSSAESEQEATQSWKRESMGMELTSVLPRGSVTAGLEQSMNMDSTSVVPRFAEQRRSLGGASDGGDMDMDVTQILPRDAELDQGDKPNAGANAANSGEPRKLLRDVLSFMSDASMLDLSTSMTAKRSTSSIMIPSAPVDFNFDDVLRAGVITLPEHDYLEWAVSQLESVSKDMSMRIASLLESEVPHDTQISESCLKRIKGVASVRAKSEWNMWRSRIEKHMVSNKEQAVLTLESDVSGLEQLLRDVTESTMSVEEQIIFLQEKKQEELLERTRSIQALSLKEQDELAELTGVVSSLEKKNSSLSQQVEESRRMLAEMDASLQSAQNDISSLVHTAVDYSTSEVETLKAEAERIEDSLTLELNCAELIPRILTSVHVLLDSSYGVTVDLTFEKQSGSLQKAIVSSSTSATALLASEIESWICSNVKSRFEWARGGCETVNWMVGRARDSAKPRKM